MARSGVTCRTKHGRPQRAHSFHPKEHDVHSDLALKMTSDLFWTGLLVCLPVLAITMAVGLVVSILQVLTQVQDMSLAFVPKLLAAGAAMVAFGPWMLRTLCSFVIALWTRIPSMF
jgi:flagellar biosynthetic protein FliQ